MKTALAFENIAEDLKELAEETIGTISERFDFSLKSVGLLDSLVDGLNFKNDTEKEKLAEQIGAYIGEVVRRNDLGNWISSESNPEYPAIGPLIVKTDTSIFDPFNWAVKRIYDGSEDNLLFKFNFMVLNKPNKVSIKTKKNKGFWGRLFELP